MSQTNNNPFIDLVISCSYNDHKNPELDFKYTNIVYLINALNLLDNYQKRMFFKNTVPKPDLYDLKEVSQWLRVFKEIFRLRSKDLARIGGVSETRMSNLIRQKESGLGHEKIQELFTRLETYLREVPEVAA